MKSTKQNTGANIDIRDTVNYKNVMKQYNLGPNGGIVTSLNLFATKFDQVLQLCEKKREPQPKYIVVDTPGQVRPRYFSHNVFPLTLFYIQVFCSYNCV